MYLNTTNGVLALSVCFSICLESSHHSAANHNIWHFLTSWKPPSVYPWSPVLFKDCLAWSLMKLHCECRDQFRQKTGKVWKKESVQNHVLVRFRHKTKGKILQTAEKKFSSLSLNPKFKFIIESLEDKTEFRKKDETHIQWKAFFLPLSNYCFER